MLNTIDHSLFHALNRGAENSFLDWFMPRVTNVHKDFWFIACAVPLIVWILAARGKRGRTAVFCALLALGVADFTGSRLAKHAFWRDRPCRRVAASGKMAVPDDHLLPGRAMNPGYVPTPEKDCPGSSSFPSSHAANSMAFASVCWWFTRGRIRWLWFVIPVVVGWSRVYIGVHFPGDVVGGWVLGALLAWAIVGWLAKPILREQIIEEKEEAGDDGAALHEP